MRQFGVEARETPGDSSEQNQYHVQHLVMAWTPCTTLVKRWHRRRQAVRHTAQTDRHTSPWRRERERERGGTQTVAHTHTHTHTHTQTGRHHAKNAGDAETHAENTKHAREREHGSIYMAIISVTNAAHPSQNLIPCQQASDILRHVLANVRAFVLHTGKGHLLHNNSKQ